VIAIVDAGPLYAAADDDDAHHDACLDVLERADLELVVPTLVVAEVAYLVGARLGAASEAAFIRGLAVLEVEAPSVDDWAVIADLVMRYADFPIGTTDASIAVLADRIDTDLIVTLDRRHFGAIRSPSGRAFRLLPELGAVHEDVTPYRPTGAA
jgi:predicted nucleic acid-binding protein